MRFMLRSKIHRATVTAVNIDYVGSITIDPDLLDAADMLEFEQVHVLNLSNGERFVTYIMNGTKGSGEVVINGAAAHKAAPGDKIIVLSFGLMDEESVVLHSPRLVLVDEANRIVGDSA